MNIRPLGDKVVVKPVKIEEKTQSGIVLPGSAHEKQYKGTVLAVGSGYRTEQGERIPLDIKEGDKIAYTPEAGVGLKYDGEEYVILNERDILVVLD